MSRKTWPLALAIAGAALALQGCDVTIHDAPKQDSTASTAPATQAPAPATDTTAATNAAPATTDTADANSTPPADTTAMANAPSNPQPDAQQPATNAMGAAAAPDDAQGQAQPSAMDSTPAGSAAPTELALFLQENPPGAGQKSASSSDQDSASMHKANAKGEAAGRGKS